MPRLLVVGLVLASVGVAAEGRAGPPTKVLFIAIDDLATALGCYGHPQVQSPQLDALAARGVRFDRAYCQIPLCNPSRASVLTGLRPDAIGVFDLERHFREARPEVITLPQLFRRHGWFAARVGKLYHYDVPGGIGTNGLDDAPSWDQVVNPRGRDTREEARITNAEPKRPISAALSWLAADGTDEEQTDGLIASAAIRILEEHRAEPLFLGVGFFRPHTPFVAPRKYFDLYPFSQVTLPAAPADDRADIPAAAFAHNCQVPHYGLDETTCRRALQAYYASVSFVDAQVGRLLAALDRLSLRDQTLVVVWSDHGYHLGEHQGIWQKRSLFEESARSPLLVDCPGMAGNGTACPSVVEFVDIYPTVAELCGLTPPAGLAGRSLRPLLENPQRAWEHDAVTQILRPGDGQPIMGRSIRTHRWRYTEWNGGEAGRELYDHQLDPLEFTNLAEDPDSAAILHTLRARLDRKAEPQPPQSAFNPARL